MSSRKETGKIGEDIAAEYLIKNRYRIIERNYRKPWGEIDIVAMSREGILTFFEVKTLAVSELENLEFLPLRPEDNLTRAKLRKLQRTCQLYAGSHKELVGEWGWRIDLLTVEIQYNKLTGSASSYNVRYYENI